MRAGISEKGAFRKEGAFRLLKAPFQFLKARETFGEGAFRITSTYRGGFQNMNVHGEGAFRKLEGAFKTTSTW